MLVYSCKKDEVAPPPPAISSFYPAGGSAGIKVTIVGSNFDTAPAKNIVKVNGVAANVISATKTKLVIAIPAGTTTGKIDVTTGNSTATSVNDFELFLDAVGSANTSPTSGYAMVVDGAGNIFITGSFAGSATFGGTTLTSQGSEDIFIAKYNPDYSLAWITQCGGSDSDRGLAITLDGLGNLYVTGYFAVSATFGAKTISASGGGGFDAFVTKLNSSGVVQWAVAAGGMGSNADIGSALTFSQNTLYVTGTFSSTATFGSTNLVANGSTDIFLAKYDPSNGNVTAAYNFGGTSDDGGLAIAVDATGNAYIGGSFFGSLTLGATTLVDGGTSFNGFLTKIAPDGSPLWAKKFGSDHENLVRSIVLDGAGNGYAGGYFTSSADLAGTNVNSAGNEDAFITRFSTATGTPTFVRTIGSNNYEELKAISIDPTGSHIYITGHFANTISIGEFSLVTAINNTDVFVARMDANGTFDWATSGGGSEFDESGGIGADAQGNIHVTGSFRNPAVFGGTALDTPIGADAFFLWRNKLF